MAEARQSRRDGGVTALVEGFFAAAWFGWGHAAAPARLGPWLTAGSVTGMLVAIAGAIIGRRYGIIVGTEFGLAGLGAALLGAFGQPDYLPVWICAVVGLHFPLLAPLLRDRNLIPLGILVTTTAAAALLTGLSTEVAPSTITGPGAGVSLTVFSLLALANALHHPHPRPPK
jgi:hypothetical protein